ncbi:MAG: hypothetical protein Q9219_000095 [cf. Caloplaca sp. 3 TL-2023]
MTALGTPPVLSTPATHILDDHVCPTEPPEPLPESLQSPEQILIRYEIDRTVAEIRQGKWKRVALQFPDDMLPDAPTVFECLSRRLHGARASNQDHTVISEDSSNKSLEQPAIPADSLAPPKLFILADTSYGACCVDEIAAEHVNADVVVHYGRGCLSPTTRLPVIHVFTHQPLANDCVISCFKNIYSSQSQSIILMSDVIYASHLQHISTSLSAEGYSSVFTTKIIHDPSSPLPNRTVPESVRQNPKTLKEWRVFHISEPPNSLLLTLASRVSDVYVYPVRVSIATNQRFADSFSTIALRRRYALLTSVSTVPIFGILINTLSVKNYLHVVEHVKSCIHAAGKKSYTFVVGKINAAKVANFSEIGAWVVIGCWESSLIDSKDFWKPIITPFELELALASDAERVWTGEWIGDFQTVLERENTRPNQGGFDNNNIVTEMSAAGSLDGETDSEPESAPPEFDLRSGRYVSQSKPMQVQSQSVKSESDQYRHRRDGSALVMRAKGDIISIRDQASPGAEFLHSRRTWNGLGSDFGIGYDLSELNDSTAVEEGRSGTARGYRSATSTART